MIDWKHAMADFVESMFPGMETTEERKAAVQMDMLILYKQIEKDLQEMKELGVPQQLIEWNYHNSETWDEFLTRLKDPELQEIIKAFNWADDCNTEFLRIKSTRQHDSH